MKFEFPPGKKPDKEQRPQLVDFDANEVTAQAAEEAAAKKAEARAKERLDSITDFGKNRERDRTIALEHDRLDDFDAHMQEWETTPVPSKHNPLVLGAVGEGPAIANGPKTFDGIGYPEPTTFSGGEQKEDNALFLGENKMLENISSPREWHHVLSELVKKTVNVKKGKSGTDRVEKDEKIPLSAEPKIEAAYFEAYKRLTHEGGKLLASADAKAVYKKASADYYKVQNSKIAEQQEYVREKREEDLAMPAWQKKMADHYKKLSKRERSVLGGKDKEKMSFEEYSQKFSNDFIERGERSVRTQMILSNADRRMQMREEALSTREKSVFEKGLKWFGEKNKQLEAGMGEAMGWFSKKFNNGKELSAEEKATGGKWGARVVRAAAGATIFLIPATLAALPVGGAALAVVGGHGAWKFLRSLGMSSSSGAIAGRGAMAYTEHLGKKSMQKAEKGLSTLKRGTRHAVLSDEYLERFDSRYEKLQVQSDERTHARKAILFGVGTTVITGGGLMSLLELNNFTDAAELLSNHDLATHIDTATQVAQGHAEAVTHAVPGPAVHPEAPHTITPPHDTAPEQLSAEDADALPATSIDHLSVSAGSGDGADTLFDKLRADLHTAYPDPSHAPPAVQHILSAHNASALSQEFGFADSHGHTLGTIQPGDQFAIDDHGRLLFQPVHGGPNAEVALMKDVDGHMLEHKVHFSEQHNAAHTPTSTHHAETHEGSTTPEQHPSEATVDQNHTAHAETITEPTNVVSTAADSHLPEELNHPLLQPEAPVEDVSHHMVSSEVPESHVAPPAPEAIHTPAPEAPHVETSVVEAGHHEAFNTHIQTHIDIAAAPRVFSHLDAQGHTVLTAFGGKGNDAFYAAQQYVEQHPGTTIRFSAVDTDPITGAQVPYHGGFASDANGVAHPIFSEPAGAADSSIPESDPKDFMDVTDFTYKK